MLNTFPTLLDFGLGAPTLLRIALALTLIYFALNKLLRDRHNELQPFSKISMPGALSLFGIVEGVSGILLLIGLYTQVAALATIIVLVLTLLLKHKTKTFTENEPFLLSILTVIALSLLFSGAGFLAFDVPL